MDLTAIFTITRCAAGNHSRSRSLRVIFAAYGLAGDTLRAGFVATPARDRRNSDEWGHVRDLRAETFLRAILQHSSHEHMH